LGIRASTNAGPASLRGASPQSRHKRASRRFARGPERRSDRGGRPRAVLTGFRASCKRPWAHGAIACVTELAAARRRDPSGVDGQRTVVDSGVAAATRTGPNRNVRSQQGEAVALALASWPLRSTVSSPAHRRSREAEGARALATIADLASARRLAADPVDPGQADRVASGVHGFRAVQVCRLTRRCSACHAQGGTLRGAGPVGLLWRRRDAGFVGAGWCGCGAVPGRAAGMEWRLGGRIGSFRGMIVLNRVSGVCERSRTRSARRSGLRPALTIASCDGVRRGRRVSVPFAWRGPDRGTCRWTRNDWWVIVCAFSGSAGALGLGGALGCGWARAGAGWGWLKVLLLVV
jgi:hypothetical protein